MATKAIKKEEARYLEAVGRRKTAVARVRMTPSNKSAILVNNKNVKEYFQTDKQRHSAIDALQKVKVPTKFNITAMINGGGISAQSEALRHGIARALLLYDMELRKKLKKAHFLKRDPRVKERKKFGLKKARKSAQWSKR